MSAAALLFLTRQGECSRYFRHYSEGSSTTILDFVCCLVATLHCIVFAKRPPSAVKSIAHLCADSVGVRRPAGCVRAVQNVRRVSRRLGRHSGNELVAVETPPVAARS